MADVNFASNEVITESVEKSSPADSIEITETVSETLVQTKTIHLEKASTSSVQEDAKSKEKKPRQPIDESLSIVIDDDDDVVNVAEAEPSISPPRKSARLSAKRRDSSTENEISSRKLCDSPVPKRRSMRLNSASSQDTPPAKSREESTNKKMPTISEIEKDTAHSDTIDCGVQNDRNNSEQALVDELAAAFVEEFID